MPAESKAPRRILAVGWGDVSRRYWGVLKERVDAGQVEVSIAELPDIARQAPQLFVEWASPELDAHLSSGEFDLVLVLTPPTRHHEVVERCLGLVRDVPKSCTILVEKPLALGVEDAHDVSRLIELGTQRSCQPHEVACVDHYTLKPVVRFFRSHSQELLSDMGAVRHLVFTSMESRELHASESFRSGYAREHAVHAFAVIDTCLPILRGHNISHQATDRRRFWRYASLSEEIDGDSAFDLECWLDSEIRQSQYLAESVHLELIGGKGLDRDEKALVVECDRGLIKMRFDEETIDLQGRLGPDTRLYDGRSSPEIPAYRFLLAHILDGKPIELVTRPIAEAARDVERVAHALADAEYAGDYGVGTCPF